MRDNEILFLDKMDLSKPKTKEAIEIVSSLSKIGGFEKFKTKKTNKAILALDKKSPMFQKASAIFPAWKFTKPETSTF